ncbi:hypothetical protein Tco_0787206 [Tanacetum coccineum]
MGTFDSLKYILTQSALDDLCEKYYIADALHPELPGPNARIRRSTTGKIGLSVIAAAKISHFEILCCVHGFVPTVGNFRSGKTLRKYSPSALDEFNAEVCDFLEENPALFKKFSEAFLRLVGISRYYTLDENYMDFFAFIHHVDPTKVNVGERETREGEVLLLELTKDRVVSLTGVYDRGDAATAGVGNDDVNEGNDDAAAMENTEQSGHVSTLAAEIGATVAATVPFVTSFVTPTPEHEGGEYADSVFAANVQTKRPAERFVISSDTPHDSNANAVDDEVSSVVRSTVPRSTIPVPAVLTTTVATTVVADSTSEGNVDPDAAGPSQPAGNDISSKSFYVSLDMDSEALR